MLWQFSILQNVIYYHPKDLNYISCFKQFILSSIPVYAYIFPIFQAILKGNNEMVEFLIKDCHADVDIRDAYGNVLCYIMLLDLDGHKYIGNAKNCQIQKYQKY